MRKKVKDWLMELPQPYRSQALDNTNVPDGDGCESLADAISCAFVWDRSPEGHEYWCNLRDRVKNGLPPLPTAIQLGNLISDIINQDGDDYTDGEVVDQIVDLLNGYGLYSARK